MIGSVTSFPAQARRVRDGTLAPQRRLSALRECTQHCAPYGFRATWHHLVASARIPRRPDDDPGALVRAIDELQRVRDVVLPRADEYARQRRREKLAGQRSLRTSPPWNSWGWSDIAYCPDPHITRQHRWTRSSGRSSIATQPVSTPICTASPAARNGSDPDAGPPDFAAQQLFDAFGDTAVPAQRVVSGLTSVSRSRTTLHIPAPTVSRSRCTTIPFGAPGPAATSVCVSDRRAAGRPPPVAVRSRSSWCTSRRTSLPGVRQPAVAAGRSARRCQVGSGA
ncbi:hypothetical protein EDC02_6028 [Micromonospora sp. Llam0]|nr:hypothetical protein EDC02_6028 [Micromonospora sp. Llam0]